MKKMNLRYSLLALTVTVLAMQACGGFQASTTNSLNLTSDATVTFATLKPSILDPQCASCHLEFQNYGALMASGYVVPGLPGSSQLYIQISAGTMPADSAALPSAEIAEINAWILSGAPSGAEVPSSGGGAASPSATATPNAANPNATFSYLEQNLFSVSCTSCHNSTSAAAGYNLQTYATAITELVTGQPNASTIYAEVSQGLMPLNGSAVSAALQQDLYDWIANGAPNN